MYRRCRYFVGRSDAHRVLLERPVALRTAGGWFLFMAQGREKSVLVCKVMFGGVCCILQWRDR
jgi:hypothetical protein